MRFTRIGVLLGSALALAVAVLAQPLLHDPGGFGHELRVVQVVTIEQAADRPALDILADLDIEPATVPGNDVWHRVADIRGDEQDLVKRLNDVVPGGRVKSASSLTVSPASRHSARV